MQMTRILHALAILISTLAGALDALAGPSGDTPPAPPAPPAIYEAGTVMVRVGASYVDPDDDTGKWRYDRELYPFFDGLRYDMGGDTTWNFTLGFMPLDHFSVEIGYIGKSEHDLDLSGLQGSFVNVFGVDKIRAGSIDRRTGTLIANWFPVRKESWIQPYIGLGGQYTDFENTRYRTNANDYLTEVAGATGPARLYMEDDWGWVGQIGVDIMLGRDSHWLVNAAVQYLDVQVQTDLHYAAPSPFDPGVAIHAARTEIEFDPWIYNLGVGYRF